MKIVSLFCVVSYNIPIIILAQYLSHFILAPEKGALNILLDFDPLPVFASSLSIASGYIINNFYDSQKT
jgi:4-hydroxybenzoate polyprenyltransferase